MKKSTDTFMGESFTGKTEEEKKRALVRIQQKIMIDEKMGRRWVWVVYGLVWFVNVFFLTTACFTLILQEDDWAFLDGLDGLPAVFAMFFKACNGWNGWLFSIAEEIKGIPNGVFYLVTVLMTMVAVPSIAILILKLMLMNFTSGSESGLQSGTLSECFKKTYLLAKHKGGSVDFDPYWGAYIAWILGVAGYVAVCGMVIWVGFLQEKAEGIHGVELFFGIFKVVVMLAIFGAILFGVICLLAFVPGMIKMIATHEIGFETGLSSLEKIWAEADPEKKAELERQKRAEAERQKRAEAERKEYERRQAEQAAKEAAEWAAAKPPVFISDVMARMNANNDSSGPSRQEVEDMMFMDQILKNMPDDWSKDV